MATQQVVAKARTIQTLCEHIASNRETATTSLNAVSRIASELVTFMNNVETAINDRPLQTAFTLTTRGWNTWANDSDGYTQYYDLAVTDLTPDDLPLVNIDLSCMEVAVRAELSPVCVSMNGAIRFKAMSVPESNITGQYWICAGYDTTTPTEQSEQSGS